jgi:hypothetical protein
LAAFTSGPKFNISGPMATGICRLSTHITSMKTDATEWSAAAGWSGDSQRRASPYLRLNVLKRL